MARKRYTVYKRVLEELKLRQLDVYRFKDHEVIRARRSDGSVVVIKLPRRRDEMTPEEFRSAVVEALSRAEKK